MKQKVGKKERRAEGSDKNILYLVTPDDFDMKYLRVSAVNLITTLMSLCVFENHPVKNAEDRGQRVAFRCHHFNL
jgi:hypothetical protein